MEIPQLEIPGRQNAHLLLSGQNGYSILLFKDNPDLPSPSVFAEVVGVIRMAGYFTSPPERQSQISQDVLAPYQALKEEVRATHFGGLDTQALKRIIDLRPASKLEWIMIRRLNQSLKISVIDIKQ